MRTLNSKSVDIQLHELPRNIRLWLCAEIGWPNPVHFGVVQLYPQSGIAKELQKRVQAHNEQKAHVVK